MSPQQKELLDLMRRDSSLPARTQVRRVDPDTSHEVAVKLGNQTVNHARVLHLMRMNMAMTDLELLLCWKKVYGEVPESTPRKRRCDLVRMGKVAKKRDASGVVVKRRIDGSRRIVWTLVS